MPIFNKEVKTMVERLKLQAKKGGTFDMYEYMDACTLDMVCRKYTYVFVCVGPGHVRLAVVDGLKLI